MADSTREAVYTIRIEDSPALQELTRIKKALDDQSATKRDLTKQTKGLIEAERALQKTIDDEGAATAEQTASLKKWQDERSETNRQLTETDAKLKNLSGVYREQINEVSGLTAMGLRFRDKMADASLEALKQSGVLEQLGTRTEVLKNEITQLNVAYSKGTTTEAEYIAQNAKLQAELTQVTTKSDKLEIEIQQLNAQFKAGLLSQSEYKAGLDNIGKQTQQLGSKFDSFVSGQAGQLKSTLSSLAVQYVGVGAAIYGVQKIIGDSIHTIAEFGVQLAKVSALGGDYAERINELGDAAKSLGPKFGVGPTKALESIEALAKAGVSASDILGGALEGALTLSASGSLAAGDAAQYAASTMVQFGLTGKDMTHVADLLSAAANKAQGEVSDFGNALKFIGPVAAGAGVSLEETTGTLALFAQNGILGEQAGTGLRGVLASLTSPSSQATKQLEQLGVITADGANKLYDAQGGFKGLANLAGVLQDATAGLTQQQKDQALGQIFGNQQITAANILLKGGTEAVNKWTDAVDDNGIAQRIASEQLNTVSGSVAKLSASWDAAVISIDKGDGPISRAIKSMTDGLASLINYAVDARGEIERLLIADIDASKARGELSNDEYNAQINTTKAITEAGRAQDALNETLKTRNLHSSDYSELIAKNNDQLLKSIGYSKTQAETEEGLRYVRETLNDEIAAAAPLLAKAQDSNQSLTYAQQVEVEARKAGIAILQQEVEKREKAIATTNAQATAQTAAAAAAKAEKATKAQGADATIGERTAYLKDQLADAKTAREALTVSDKAGRAEADKNIASLNKQIAALEGTTKATREENKALREQEQLKRDLDKEQAGLNSGKDPQTQAINAAEQEADARRKIAAGNADLLAEIDSNLAQKRIEIDTKFEADRQAIQDTADKDLAQRHAQNINADLELLKQDQALQFQAAANNGDDLVALAQQQYEQQQGLIQQQHQAAQDALIASFDQQYQVYDEQGLSTLDLQAQQGVELQNLKDQQRADDLTASQQHADALLDITRQQNAIENELLSGFGEVVGEALSGRLKDQKDFEKQFLLVMLKATKAQVELQIARASAASLASPESVATFGAAGLAKAAILTGLIEGLFAGLSAFVQGFAVGGEVPQQRGTVTSSWGRTIQRSNGDNVLVTLKRGEVVLNEDQQDKVKRKTGMHVGSLAGIPGHQERQLAVMRDFRTTFAYAGGGTVGISSPRPDPASIVNNQIVVDMKQLAQTPIYTRITEVNDAQARVALIQERGTA